MKQIAVIGDGGWGTALALVLRRNGHGVTVWGPFPEYIHQIQRTGENTTFLPGIAIPPEIRWTSDPQEASRHADVLLIVTPSAYYRSALESFFGLLSSNCRIISATKGLDTETHQRMSETAASMLNRRDVAVLSGPSHAEEVARREPAAVTIACVDNDVAKMLQTIFSNPVFRVYTSTDVIGVELGGVLKNVMAIAAGICDGLGFGDNTKAALITRGLAEMTRLGTALGAQPATFSGLSGIGDLMVTCMSAFSRNRSVGERLGRGESIQAITESMEQIAEGVPNSANAEALARDARVETPIIDEVYAVVHEGKDSRKAVESLLGRDLREE